MLLLPKPAHPQPLLLHWSERDTCIKISKICCVLLRLLSLAPSFFLDLLSTLSQTHSLAKHGYSYYLVKLAVKTSTLTFYEFECPANGDGQDFDSNL